MDEPVRHHGVTLQEFAVLSAHLAEGTPLGELLARRGWSEDQWNSATFAWTEAFAADVRAHGVEAPLPLAFSEVFVFAQDALHPVRPLEPEGWAALQYRMETEDRDAVLAESGLKLADYLRLVRAWSTILSTDPVAADRHARAFDELRHRR